MPENDAPKNVEPILTDEPTDEYDPRMVYAELTIEQARASWPCAICDTRRDEHASDPTPSWMPALDITDHDFTPAVGHPPRDEGLDALRYATGGYVEPSRMPAKEPGSPSYLLPKGGPVMEQIRDALGGGPPIYRELAKELGNPMPTPVTDGRLVAPSARDRRMLKAQAVGHVELVRSTLEGLSATVVLDSPLADPGIATIIDHKAISVNRIEGASLGFAVLDEAEGVPEDLFKKGGRIIATGSPDDVGLSIGPFWGDVELVERKPKWWELRKRFVAWRAGG